MLLESWISPKTKKGLPSKIAGKGFFAAEPIKKGEVVSIKAGHIIDQVTLDANRDMIQGSELGIYDGLYIAPMTREEFPLSMISFNHSCDPNCGIGGNTLVIAIRDVKAGEELTTDYAMHDTDPKLSMQCNCQSPSCRHTITGNDWEIPELQKKYEGYFSWYIDQKIKQSATTKI